MDDVQLALLVDTGFAATVAADVPSSCRSAALHTSECSQQANAAVEVSDFQSGSNDGADKFPSSATYCSAKPFSPAAAPPAPPPPPPAVSSATTPSLKSPPLMSSPAFAAALQSVVLNKTPKQTPAPPLRSLPSPGMSKGGDLMAALVARISARRRRMTYATASNLQTLDVTLSSGIRRLCTQQQQRHRDQPEGRGRRTGATQRPRNQKAARRPSAPLPITSTACPPALPAFWPTKRRITAGT
jgi:hypothetical protein